MSWGMSKEESAGTDGLDGGAISFFTMADRQGLAYSSTAEPGPSPTTWSPPTNGVSNALAIGYAILEDGGTAVDAVEAAVTVMEDDETFDAGRGSFLTSDGRVQLDALLMDGSNLRAGGVACVERLRNPIQAARLVLDKSPHVYFVGAGAERFAQPARHGTLRQLRTRPRPRAQPPRRSPVQQRRSRRPPLQETTTFSGRPVKPPAPKLGMDSHDTVGAVALDAHGNLAAATSTGGTLNKAPGRVGDSSLIGCGCYADNLSAAVSLTGWGEPIMKLVLGKWAVDRVQRGVAPKISADGRHRLPLQTPQGHGGIILLGPDGRFGLAHNTPAWPGASPTRKACAPASPETISPDSAKFSFLCGNGTSSKRRCPEAPLQPPAETNDTEGGWILLVFDLGRESGPRGAAEVSRASGRTG
jgi:beta-aspartyl-peptidase (threonine type)